MRLKKSSKPPSNIKKPRTLKLNSLNYSKRKADSETKAKDEVKPKPINKEVKK